MSFRQMLCYALCASFLMLVPLQGQIPKSIFPSRTNADATAPRDATPGASAPAAGCANGICYHGGPLMLGTPTVYYIWYGNWAADPTAVSILSHLAQFDGGSPYYAINSTYYDSTNTHVGNSINFGPSYTDNYSLGKELNDVGILTIVANAIAGGHLPSDPNGVYFVLTWQDVQETTGFATTYCGWHTSVLMNGVDIKFAFVGNANTQGLTACAIQTASSPNGDPAADAMASIVAHELEESISDPDLNAWYDTQNNENADKCAWTFGAVYTAGNGSLANMNLGGLDYLIQQNWVNASGGYCAQKLPPTPLISSLTPATGAAGSSVPITISGVNLMGATISFSGSGITASAISTSANQITATFAIAAGAIAGPQNVTVKTSAGTSNAISFAVTTPPPALTSITPSSGVLGAAVSVTLAGSNLAGASINALAGISISNISSSASQVTATFTIASNAATGPRNVTVTTTSGTSSALTFTINAGTSVFTPIRINAGGAAYTDAQGNVWSADSGFNGGAAGSTTATIAGTSDQPLFRTWRAGPDGQPLVYTFNGIPNGSHTVALGLDETVVSSSGLRVFNVIINGQTVLANFDIFQAAGFSTAIIESFPVNVSNGQLVIQFSPLTARPPRVNTIAIQ